jgi:hypothetical protein
MSALRGVKLRPTSSAALPLCSRGPRPATRALGPTNSATAPLCSVRSLTTFKSSTKRDTFQNCLAAVRQNSDGGRSSAFRLHVGAYNPSFHSTATMATATRTESDAFGEVQVDADRYWGAQTERSLENFKINQPNDRMPPPVVRAFGILKGAAATVNERFGLGESQRCASLRNSCAQRSR